MKFPRLMLFASAGLALLLAGCGQTATPADETSPEPIDLAGTHWVLSELDGESLVEGTTITAQFSDDQKVSGNAGCNQYNGSYTIDGQTITVDENVATTMMACEESVMTQETAFLTVLIAASNITLTDEQLTLDGDQGTLLFTVQSQELAGTNWTILGYLDGSGVVSVLADSEPTLEFGDDGVVSGNASCNQMTGGYTAAEGVLEFGPLAITQMACPEPDGVMEQEAAIVAALESATKYVISGDDLTLRTADDLTALRLTRS
ncbi:MAG: META domain-containing protein [Brooklawnia sp.]|jgi:heat shock protein HslJ